MNVCEHVKGASKGASKGTDCISNRRFDIHAKKRSVAVRGRRTAGTQYHTPNTSANSSWS